MKKKIIGIVVLMILATTVVSATNINMKENIQPATFNVDVPIWEKGYTWTYNENYINHGYKEDGTLSMLWYHNCTSTYEVIDSTGDHYTVKMTSTDNEGSLMIGRFRLKYTPFTKLTGDISIKKTDLAWISESWTEKGFVLRLFGKIGIPFPAQYSDTWGQTYTPPLLILPFPLNAGNTGTLPNSTWEGHEKMSLYWGLIKIIDSDYSGYSGEQNYTCEMANITVPAGNYDSYNVSVESTFGTEQTLLWTYYAPEVGWYAKQTYYQEYDIGKPGWIFKCELVSTTYTP